MSPKADAAAPESPLMGFAHYQALLQLHAAYSHAVDQGDWDAWCALFIPDCLYRVVPRENHDRGFPLATLSFESQGMLRDRAYAIRETLFHDPYRQRHVVGAPLVTAETPDGGWRCEASYAVFRTKLDGETTVFNVGRYLDHIVPTPSGFRFAERVCVYDSEWIPNSLIYPI